MKNPTVTTATFTYTKPDGSRSNRKLLVLSQPSDSYFGVEYKDDNLTDVANVLDYLTEKAQMDEYLKQKYGLTAATKYRRFKKDGISRLVEDKVAL